MSSASWAAEDTTTVSLPSALVQTGSGVPQKRERETAQSRAPSSQLRKRLSRTYPGTQRVASVCSISRSRRVSTRMK